MRKICLITLLTLSTAALGAVNQPGALNRNSIKAKMDNMVVPVFGPVNGFTLGEIVRVLNQTSKKSAPPGGINIVINLSINAGHSQNNNNPKDPTRIDPITGLPIPPRIDPVTGLPIPEPIPNPLVEGVPEKPDPDKIRIRGLSSVLRGLTFRQILNLVVMAADVPLTYTVQDWGVLITRTTRERNSFFVRRMQLSRPFAFPGRKLTLIPSVRGLNNLGQTNPRVGYGQKNR